MRRPILVSSQQGTGCRISCCGCDNPISLRCPPHAGRGLILWGGIPFYPAKRCLHATAWILCTRPLSLLGPEDPKISVEAREGFASCSAAPGFGLSLDRCTHTVASNRSIKGCGFSLQVVCVIICRVRVARYLRLGSPYGKNNPPTPLITNPNTVPAYIYIYISVEEHLLSAGGVYHSER